MKKVEVAAQLRVPNQKQGELGLYFKPIQAMSLRTKALIVPPSDCSGTPVDCDSGTCQVGHIFGPVPFGPFDDPVVQGVRAVTPECSHVVAPSSGPTVCLDRLSDTRNLSRSHGCVVPLALLLVRTLQVFLPKGFLLRPSRATKKFEMEKHCAGRAV